MRPDIVLRLNALDAFTSETAKDAVAEIERLRVQLAAKEVEIKRVHAELVKYTGDGHTLSEPYTPEAL